MLETVARVLRSLDAGFGQARVAEALEEVAVFMHVYARANDKAGPGFALLELFGETLALVADLHMLAPSEHAATTTMVGEPHDWIEPEFRAWLVR